MTFLFQFVPRVTSRRGAPAPRRAPSARRATTRTRCRTGRVRPAPPTRRTRTRRPPERRPPISAVSELRLSRRLNQFELPTKHFKYSSRNFERCVCVFQFAPPAIMRTEQLARNVPLATTTIWLVSPVVSNAQRWAEPPHLRLQARQRQPSAMVGLQSRSLDRKMLVCSLLLLIVPPPINLYLPRENHDKCPKLPKMTKLIVVFQRPNLIPENERLISGFVRFSPYSL